MERISGPNVLSWALGIDTSPLHRGGTDIYGEKKGPRGIHLPSWAAIPSPAGDGICHQFNTYSHFLKITQLPYRVFIHRVCQMWKNEEGMMVSFVIMFGKYGQMKRCWSTVVDKRLDTRPGICGYYALILSTGVDTVNRLAYLNRLKRGVGRLCPPLHAIDEPAFPLLRFVLNGPHNLWLPKKASNYDTTRVSPFNVFKISPLIYLL